MGAVDSRSSTASNASSRAARRRLGGRGGVGRRGQRPGERHEPGAFGPAGQRLQPRPERGSAVVGVGAARQHGVPPRGGLAGERVDEAGLADPRLAAHEHGAVAAGERGAQHLERRVPPDQLHARSLGHGAGNGTAPGGAGG